MKVRFFFLLVLVALLARPAGAQITTSPGGGGGSITYDETFTNIVQALAGGGVVSNYIDAADDFVVDTWYTNSTAYWVEPRAQIELQTSTGTIVEMQVRTNLANTDAQYHRRIAISDSGATMGATVSADFLVPPAAAWRWAVTAGSAAIDNTAPQGTELVYWGSGGGGEGTLDEGAVATLVAGGTLTFAGEGSGLTNINAATWDGLTNYTATLVKVDTNVLLLTGANAAVVNGWYYWNASQSTFTNASGSGFDYVIDPPNVYITNGASYLYLTTAGAYTAWEDGEGGTPTPTGSYTNIESSVTAQRSASAYRTDFPQGVTGTLGIFSGSGVNIRHGEDVTPGSSLSSTLLYPPFVGSSEEIELTGPYHTVFSSVRITNSGQRIFVAASSTIDARATNADYTILSSEFGVVRQGQGVGFIGASSAFGDYSPSGSYAMLAASSWTNQWMHFGGVFGGSALDADWAGGGAGSSLYWMNNSIGINTGGTTNWHMNNSTIIGQRHITTNVSHSVLIGLSQRVNTVTNNYLFGHGLASSSNNVVKIGFPGWHLLIQTNRLQLISNNVAFNITVTPE